MVTQDMLNAKITTLFKNNGEIATFAMSFPFFGISNKTVASVIIYCL